MAISRREALALSGLAIASNAFAGHKMGAPAQSSKSNEQPKPKTNYKAPIPDTDNLPPKAFSSSFILFTASGLST